jgi:hypothetical protein
VRFVLGNRSSLKYGARLIHSVLGDSSNVSCCEILNNLVFPFHEQHHNNSFLIASLVMGQSNMAAGATIGSNHNSRGNDGEIIAGRGFWPGLSATLKHNSRFASFTLIKKGNYGSEIRSPFPFALLSQDAEGCLEIVPAWWWLHNMYALQRNSRKFAARDKRIHKTQFVETAFLAPDTAEEILFALDLLENNAAPGEIDTDEDVLLVTPGILERSDNPVKICGVEKARNAYKDMLLYYCMTSMTASTRQNTAACAESSWVNLGGQLVPAAKVRALRADIVSGALPTWEAVHERYAALAAEYPADKAAHAAALLARLGPADPAAEYERVKAFVKSEVIRTKARDFSDPFRKLTYRNEAEMTAVLGRLADNEFVKLFL